MRDNVKLKSLEVVFGITGCKKQEKKVKWTFKDFSGILYALVPKIEANKTNIDYHVVSVLINTLFSLHDVGK